MQESKISLLTASLININMMVGAGIFLFPQLMAQTAGYYGFLGWPIVAAIFLPIVLSIAQVATLFPGEGSFYNYSKGTLGKTVGFLSGWLYALGYISVSAIHLGALKTIFSKEAGIAWVGENPMLFYALFVGLFWLINLLPLDIIGRMLNVTTILKLIPLLVVCGLFVFYLTPPASAHVDQLPSLGALLGTIPFALFGYWGFESCVNISHRIKGKPSNASKAILIGFIATAAIYTIFHLSISHIMGTQALAREGVRAFVHHLGLPNPWLQKAFVGGIKFAITMAHIGVFWGVLVTVSQLVTSMANENLMFASSILKKTNRYGQPYVSLAVQGLIAFILSAFITSQSVLTAITNLGILAAFFLTLVSLFLIARKKGNIKNLLMILLGFASCCLLAYYSFQEIGHWYNSIPFLLIAFGGFVMYKLHEAFSTRRAL